MMGEWLCIGFIFIWAVAVIGMEYFKWKRALARQATAEANERTLKMKTEFYDRHCKGCLPCEEHEQEQEDDEDEDDEAADQGDVPGSDGR
jgi:hypothetical protein